jgi:nitroimidazol reductase NimA-like FMN-containing flavoprotein (pyridoxamine 5'-phosphate oxidase superfamily)
MHETSEDLQELQALLDRSDAAGGRHLRSIITDERRLTAEQVAAALPGMTLLVLATVSSKGRPIAGPVDGIFYRGHWYFGSAPDSIRFTHIRRSPYVSATHLPGEHLAVTVHGQAVPIDVSAPEHAAFREHLLGIYLPRYGDEWQAMLDGGAVYARIDAERMFTFSMPDA